MIEPENAGVAPPTLVADEPALPTDSLLPVTDVVPALRALPDPNTNEFLVESRRLAARLPDDRDILLKVIDDQELPRIVRFNALYMLLFRLRRLKDFREYREVVDRYRSEFASFPLFHTFDAVYERSVGDDRRSIERAIRAVERAMSELDAFPGVLHQFAEFVASLGELHGGASREQLRAAEDAVMKAIALSDAQQPHFWATLARLQALTGDFDAARRSIVEAIEMEPSTGRDYALRITEYRLIQTQISFLQERTQVDKRDREAREELLAIRGQLVGILGLLAAVVAFITTSLSISTAKTFSESSRLLVLMGAILVCVFTVFAYAFRVTPLRRVLLPLALALGVGAVAIFYTHWPK